MHSDRPPLMPHNSNTPHVRPRHAPDSSHVNPTPNHRPGGHGGGAGNGGRSSESLSQGNSDISLKILEEVRRAREEQKCM